MSEDVSTIALSYLIKIYIYIYMDFFLIFLKKNKFFLRGLSTPHFAANIPPLKAILQLVCMYDMYICSCSIHSISQTLCIIHILKLDIIPLHNFRMLCNCVCMYVSYMQVEQF